MVGFGLVALPLLIAVLWALFNLDRLAEQSEALVTTGIQAADNNRLLTEHIGQFDRAAQQHTIFRSQESLQLLRQDLATIEDRLDRMRPLAELSNSTAMLVAVATRARNIVEALSAPGLTPGQAQVAIAQFAPLREEVSRVTRVLSAYVDMQLTELQERTQRAQQVSAWQVAALVPGTIILVLFFTLLVAKPIRQIDSAIRQLGESGFSKRDLERLGR